MPSYKTVQQVYKKICKELIDNVCCSSVGTLLGLVESIDTFEEVSLNQSEFQIGLKRDLNFDELDHIEAIMFLEDEFGVEISDNWVDHEHGGDPTLDQIAIYIFQELGRKGDTV